MPDLYVTYENQIGDRKYQPCLPDGTRLIETFVKSGSGWTWDQVWSKENRTPVLYKSLKRAERVARREQKRRERVLLGEYREIKPEEVG